jgi:hypothetical protein
MIRHPRNLGSGFNDDDDDDDGTGRFHLIVAVESF